MMGGGTVNLQDFKTPSLLVSPKDKKNSENIKNEASKFSNDIKNCAQNLFQNQD